MLAAFGASRSPLTTFAEHELRMAYAAVSILVERYSAGRVPDGYPVVGLAPVYDNGPG
jgi:hypothetical protein